jgi:hypothetical protein
MKQTLQTPSNFAQCLGREDLLIILETSYKAASFRFLRQSAMAWLTCYPGDLSVTLWLAKALLGEGKLLQAQPVLEKLLRLDPEFSEAQEALSLINPIKPSVSQPGGIISDSKTSADASSPNWVRLLRSARRLLKEGRQDDAEKIANQVLGTETAAVQAAILQAQLKSARQDFPGLLTLVQLYRAQWPDCLQFTLFQAEALLETGDEAGAVKLLHRCVVSDAGSQVPVRIWGENFPYRPLWPYPLEISFDLPIPAEVAGRLGWNLLPANSSFQETDPPTDKQDAEVEIVPEAHGEPEVKLSIPFEVSTGGIFLVGETAEAAPQPDLDDEHVLPFLEGLLDLEMQQEPDPAASQKNLESSIENDILPEDSELGEDQRLAFTNRPAEIPPFEQINPEEETGSPSPVEKAVEPIGPFQPPLPVEIEPDEPSKRDETLSQVQEEFERIAKRLKRPGLGRADGRFPVYVVFSTETGLKKQYGEATLTVLDKEMRRMADQIRSRSGWDAMVYYPDGTESTEKLGLSPVDNPADPWKLKLALADLDSALAKKGEMIGALLIVGGSEVVPFHHLPNPTEDMDSLIASDNPYATLDSNYFISDWPIGRLPGEAGSDAGLLLEQLRKMVRYHSKNSLLSKKKSLEFWGRVRIFLGARQNRTQKASFGYTAAVWRRSSLAVFRSIGEAGTLLACPPQASGSFPNKKPVTLAYYNLHGLIDAAEWYGQRDINDKSPGPDYPVALSPKDLTGKTPIPDIIFSEACYGAHIEGKCEDQAISLKFVARGSLAMIGSTSAAYGSVTTPLIGADLLGHYFWVNLKSGSTVGEALMQAKVDLVQEMTRRQGFLDSEDQKTLISFVLYGDPLVSLDPSLPPHKNILRSHSHPTVKTISDRKEEDVLTAQPVPSAILKQVKGIMANYLSGLENAEIRLSEQQVTSNGKSGTLPSGAKSTQPDNSGRVVVTMHKEVYIGQKTQHQYARVTLDPKGKMVKIALTR